jgi:hypothetical protein
MDTYLRGHEKRDLQTNLLSYLDLHGLDRVAEFGYAALYGHHHGERIALFRTKIRHSLNWCADPMGKSNTHGAHSYARWLFGRWRTLRL